MKKLFALLLALALLVCVSGCAFLEAKPVDMPTVLTDGEGATDTTAKLMKFTVVVVYQDKTQKEFTYETNEEFVGSVLEAEGLIKGNAGPYGMEITHVDGVKAVYNEDKAYWAVYEGEEYALQGIDTTKVVDGGIYKLVYTNA